MATILVSFLVAKLGVHDLEKKKKSRSKRERKKAAAYFGQGSRRRMMYTQGERHKSGRHYDD